MTTAGSKPAGFKDPFSGGETRSVSGAPGLAVYQWKNGYKTAKCDYYQRG